ncbi:MAG: zincin-like metallopeptidase domain-containing protein [Rhodoferax sp.]|nr:zincin-like metallopeptidase domain-containing protein [Rhodoferax sp.]
MPGTWRLAPANLASGRPYRGINVLLLNLRARGGGYGSNRWMTFQQARSLGAYVRQGEQGTPIVFFKMHEVGSGDGSVARVTTPASRGDDRKVIPLLRSFTVFNAAQIVDLPEALQPVSLAAPDWNACEVAELILTASQARIRHGGTRAFYAPAEDVIQLPERGAFASAEAYYGVALHELTHWSGHPSRCNRVLASRSHIEAYAFEELVAEMGSAFLSNYCGLPGQLQHASYIESWLQALRHDKRLIFTAASLAQKAADYLLPELLACKALAASQSTAVAA